MFIDEPDERVNALGAKGVGEVVSVGAIAAIANAIHHLLANVSDISRLGPMICWHEADHRPWANAFSLFTLGRIAMTNTLAIIAAGAWQRDRTTHGREWRARTHLAQRTKPSDRGPCTPGRDDLGERRGDRRDGVLAIFPAENCAQACAAASDAVQEPESRSTTELGM
jgi:hypothetical protein